MTKWVFRAIVLVTGVLLWRVAEDSQKWSSSPPQARVSWTLETESLRTPEVLFVTLDPGKKTANMAEKIWDAGSHSWTPSNDGVTDGTSVTFECIGPGGNGGDGDFASTAGGGGGGGAYTKVTVVISDASATYSVFVSSGGSAQATTVTDPTPSDICSSGSGQDGTTGFGGDAGPGVVGDVLRDGGTGGQPDTDSGGGGGGGAGDSVTGNAGSNGSGSTGGAGGAGVTQFGVSDRGAGGTGGDSGANGVAGSVYGGGGGGGAINGFGGAGADGRVRATWTSSTPTAWNVEHLAPPLIPVPHFDPGLSIDPDTLAVVSQCPVVVSQICNPQVVQ